MFEVATKRIPLDRPSFMIELGLLPPYELADVKAAYHNKALAAHPDRGGNPSDFIRLKAAYDQAVEYVTFQGNRRGWIAAQVDQYVQQTAVIEEVLRRGGRVELERFAWTEQVWGDGFALLTERVRHIYVRDMSDGDRFLEFLAEHRPVYLMGLDISGSRLSTEGLRHLASFDVLNWLDVSGTDVSYRDLQTLVNKLPSLERINVRQTRLGWIARWHLRLGNPQLQITTQKPRTVIPGSEAIDCN